MTIKDSEFEQFEEMRRKAERKAAQSPETLKAMSPEEIRHTVHELQVHQIELEMQNEELRRAQMELEASRARYFDLYDLAPVGYCTISEQGLILEANLTAISLLGVARGTLTKQPISRFILTEDRDIDYLHRKDLFETGAPQVYELRMVRAGNLPFWARLDATCAQDEDGLPVCRVVLSDITERKQAEEVKNRLEAHLQQAQKMERIATLSGGIAHQFNNALSPVSLYLDMLEMNYPGDKKISNYTKQMKGSVHRMAELTSQLLAYARGGKYQAKAITINDFIDDTLPIIHPTINPDISIETDLATEVLNISADQTQMQMLLSAVLVNASEAMEGKGIIRISTKEEEIDEDFVKYHSNLKLGRYVCIEVEDSGKGMDKETRDRIFEPFFTTKFEGRGLGMASAYGIVKNHNGWISVYSEDGRGTVVRIYLPLIEARIEKPKKKTVAPIKGTGTILLIEDEELVMDVNRAVLEELGYHVLGAMTGDEAVNIAKIFDGEIDLAILDMVLPDMDGKTIYPLIMEARPNQKVLICSGYSIDGPAQEVLDAGAQDFIQKPFTMAALSEKIKEVLEGK